MPSLLQQLEQLRPELAAAAQAVIDDWIQDEEGFDPDLGAGGVCDQVSEAMSSVITSAIDGVGILDGGHDGDDHAWLIVHDGSEAAGVDIPPSVYETGGGYNWRKLEDARVDPEDIAIWKLNRRDIVAGKDTDSMRLQPGPAFRLQPDGTWAVEAVPAVVTRDARFSGFLVIEGYWCAVFELGGEEWAQKAAGEAPPDSPMAKLSAIARRVARRTL